MGLSATMNIAQSALQTNAALSSIVGRNIAGANDPGYSRKTGDLSTNAAGAASVVAVSRATNVALFNALLSANSDAAASQALSDGLDAIEQTVSLTNTSSASSTSTTTDTSPATLIGTLASALQTYAADPSSTASGQAAVSAAKALAANLNAATSAVQAVRTQADAAIATSVKTVNALLAQYQDVNAAIVKGTATGADTTDDLDTRDKILQSLSQQMGITTSSTANGGMSIYTDSGVALFDGTVRTVSFTPTAAYAAGTTGGAVSVGGVAITGDSAPMPLKSGALVGLTELRDTTTVAYQDQLDQIAQGLVSTFAESDQTGGTAPTIPGLFTAPGASATATSAPVGLAGIIAVNANVDPTQGGVLTRLRDGGIGDPGNSAYVANPTGAASDADHLTALLTALDGNRAYDATSGGSASGSLAAYAASSVSWLESSRQGATAASTNSAALVSATTTTLSSSTGVNLDDELAKMLDLEHSYSASAELMTTVKTMFDNLLSAIQ